MTQPTPEQAARRLLPKGSSQEYISRVAEYIALRDEGTVASSLKRLPEMPKSQRHITPPAFAEWLISIAQRCEPANEQTVGSGRHQVKETRK